MNCRSNILLVVLLCTTLTLGSAQEITGGFKLGMNLASMHGYDVTDAKFKLGFCGGGFVAFSLGHVAVIQPELLYSQKGAKWEEVFYDETWRVTYKFNYLEMPVLFKMILPVQGNIKPSFFLGPYFGIVITDPRGEIEYDGTTMGIDLVGTKDTDLGVVFGGGVDFGMKRGKFVFDVRYCLGLTTLDKTGYDVKNNVASFLLGYAF